MPDGPRDLRTPTDVHDLVIEFYREIVFDELLEPVFGEQAEVDWAEHIPHLIDYWNHILFGTPFRGAVTRTHRELHHKGAIRAEHCDRWLVLWVRCVDGHWTGPVAHRAKRHATVLMAGLARRVFDLDWAPPAAVVASLSRTASDDTAAGTAPVGGR